MGIIDDETMDTRTQTRIVVYDLLRRVFLHEPTVEFSRRLDESNLLEELFELPGIKKMHSCIQPILKSGDIDDAQQDFYQLFLGPRRLKAPPWESVYRSQLRLVNQESTAEVRCLYAQYGFQTEEGQLEDHFGTECDFLHRLCMMIKGSSTEQIADLMKVQKHFVSEHLVKWVPGFAMDIRHNARTPFFRGMGEFIDYWIWTEHYYLNEVVHGAGDSTQQKGRC
ncbi:Tat proofreading chaperone DmsD [bacterium BMS3Abin01]|nr:Tat proofreading chaperone DmsD [bacterium BMS3Abin01]HDY69459.1 hypothetical protein [Actinomycetota bacterium]